MSCFELFSVVFSCVELSTQDNSLTLAPLKRGIIIIAPVFACGPQCWPVLVVVFLCISFIPWWNALILFAMDPLRCLLEGGVGGVRGLPHPYISTSPSTIPSPQDGALVLHFQASGRQEEGEEGPSYYYCAGSHCQASVLGG